MRFLLDECIAPSVGAALIDAGHDVVHVREAGLLGAEDIAVMALAHRDGRILVSADTGFGQLLALGRSPGPSIVIFRRGLHNPAAQARLLLFNLPELQEHLEAGAVVVLTPDRVRFRVLPIDNDDQS